MAKYSGNLAFEQIDKTRKWSAQGAHGFTLYNAGNVNATINKVLVLQPGDSWEGPNVNPEVEWNCDIDIEFDTRTDPSEFAPVGGTAPPLNELIAGDPPPPRDTRIIIFKAFLEAKK